MLWGQLYAASSLVLLPVVDFPLLVQRHIVAGLIAGMFLAIGLSRGFSAAVEQMPSADLPLLLGITAALAVTAGAALFVPARRAATLQILHALRRE